ncbi:MAG: membrane protein [Saprospiraceae bacterium]|nr:MAG: membrane protein [Saprospiraceae bacterium]
MLHLKIIVLTFATMLQKRIFHRSFLWILFLAEMFILLPLASWAQGQHCNLLLQGKVVDTHNGEALAFANVIAAPQQIGTITDESGHFVLSQICPGPLEMVISHLGCETLRLKFDIQSDTTLQIELEHHVELLESITVVSKRVEGSATQTKSTLEGAKLDALMGKSLGESLKSIAGLNTLKTGPTISKPIIHGLHSSRILLLNNGIRQEGQEWGSDHAPEIDPFVANRITVIKGAAAVQYGLGAMSGVVLIEPAALPKNNTMGGQIHLIGRSNGNMGIAAGELEGGWKKWKNFGWRLQASLRRSGDLKAPAYSLTNTAMSERSFSLAAGSQTGALEWKTYYSYFQTTLGILRSAHIGNLTDLEAALQSERPLFIEDFSYEIQNPKQLVRHHLAKLEASRNWENIGKLQLIYGFQFNHRQEFDLRRGGRDDIPAIDLDLTTHSIALSFAHLPWRKHLSGKMGISGLYQQNRNVPGTGVRPLIPWYNSPTLGIYWIEKWIANKWQVEAGLRYDYKTIQAKRFDEQQNLQTINLDFNGFTFNLGAFYQPGDRWMLSTNLGTTFRPPNISELFSDGLHHAVAAIEEGSTDLQIEKAWKWINSLKFQQDPWQVEIDAYFHLINDYIFLQPDATPRLTIRGAFPVFSYQQTDAWLWGVDFTGQLEVYKDLLLRIKGNWVRAKDVEKDQPLIYIPADRVEGSLLYAIHTNSHLKDIQFSCGLEHTSRQNRTPEGVDYAPSPQGFILVNAAISGNVLLGKQTLGIHLKLENLLNTAYRDYLDRLRYYADSPGRNFEFSIQYKF